MSPAAVPPPSDSGDWLAHYSELQSSLFVTLARPLGLGGPGGRDAFGDLFQIAATAAWVKERDGETIRNPRAFLRQVIVNQRKMQLRSARRHPAASFVELVATADSAGPSTAEAIADRRPSVSEQVERRELADIIAQILLTIERRARAVWTMRMLEGRSPEEVMAALGITHRQYARLTVSPDGKYCLANYSGNGVVLWNTVAGTIAWETQLPGPVRDLKFAADGRHFATANGNGTVYVFRVPKEARADTPASP